MICYYAHCKSIYNTPQEKRDIATLERLGFIVLNPNSPEYEAGWKEQGMDYAQVLLDRCYCIAFRGLPDGNIPCGVYTEIEMAEEREMPCFELPSRIRLRELSYPETVEYLMEVGER